MPGIRRGSRGVPYQTATERCAVKPANQVCLLSSLVPVLPAAGRP